MMHGSARLNVSGAGEGRLFVTASFSDPADAYSAVAEALSEAGAEIVLERIFGSLSVEGAVRRARRDALEKQGIPADGPLTYIQGHPPEGEGFSGVFIQAAARSFIDDIRTIEDRGVPCGRSWRRGGAAYHVLQNLQGRDVKDVIDNADRILRDQGCGYRGVIRTWFYLSRILEWYDDFNAARNEVYHSFGLMPRPEDPLQLPASTGIEGDASGDLGIVLDLLALEPGESGLDVAQLHNPAQADAYQYGSSFSRGAVIHDNDVKIIHVSGTAAIDEDGASLYPGDIREQIRVTFDKVEALLAREGAALKDIRTATVFVKHPEDAIYYQEEVDVRELGEFPGICMRADVCREELLFELDAVAAVE